MYGASITKVAKLAGFCPPVKHLTKGQREEFVARKTYRLHLAGKLTIGK